MSNRSPESRARNIVSNIEKNALTPGAITQKRLNNAMNQISLMNIPHLLRGQLARRLNTVRNARSSPAYLNRAAMNRIEPENRKRLANLLSGRREPTRENIQFLANKKVNMMGINNSNNNSNSGKSNSYWEDYYKILTNINKILNKIPVRTNWNMVNFTAPALFHGSATLLKRGYPDKPGGSWFAKSPHQSILHAINRGNGKPSYLYVYHMRTPPPRLIDVKTVSDFNKLGLNLTRAPPNNLGSTYAFGASNFNVASRLCALTPKIADGWHFPRDQDQVMLCEPKKFLKLYKAYKIKGTAPPLTVPYTVNWAARESRWKRPKGLRYNLEPIQIIHKKRTTPSRGPNK